MKINVTLKEAERLAYANGDVRAVAEYRRQIQAHGENFTVFVEVDPKPDEVAHDNHKAG